MLLSYVEQAETGGIMILSRLLQYTWCEIFGNFKITNDFEYEFFYQIEMTVKLTLENV